MAISIVGTSGVTAAAINGSTLALTFPATSAVGDIALAFNVTPRAGPWNVYSSGGTAYTQLVTASNGNLNVNLCYRICGAGELTATASESGAAQDGVCAAVFLLRGASPYFDVNVSSAATGTSSQPNSPAVFANHANDMVFSCVAALSNSAAAVTAPSGYTSLVSTGATDTRSTQLGMSRVLSTNTANTPLSYDPSAYSSFTSAAWIGITVSVTSTDPYTAFDLMPQSVLPSVLYGRIEVVGY